MQKCRESIVILKIYFEIYVEKSLLGSPELEKVFLQNVCLVCMQRHWREKYSIDTHEICKKNIKRARKGDLSNQIYFERS